MDAVVADTTKVRIFKQITTSSHIIRHFIELLLIPQRYEFSSKSQRGNASYKDVISCCWYHKGTNFQANHNRHHRLARKCPVVADTTKVRIFKQITTSSWTCTCKSWLLLIPQRYEFSSKSQHDNEVGRKFIVVADTTKVRIFKQITTHFLRLILISTLLLIPQRYEFSSKSQQPEHPGYALSCCCWYHKGTNFQANHNKLLDLHL